MSDLSGVLNPPTCDTKLGWELVERRGRGHRSDQVVGGSGAGLQTVISLEKVEALRSMNLNSSTRIMMLNSRGDCQNFSGDTDCFKKGHVLF